MTGRKDESPLHERMREALIRSIEQAFPGPGQFERGKEIAEYAMDLVRPALDALEEKDYLDCLRHLDAVAIDATALGLSELVKLPAKYAVRSSRGSAQADLIRGWAERVVGYVHLTERDLGKARRSFRRALRNGRIAEDATLIGAALLSIGYTHQRQGKEIAARGVYEEALPYARASEEPWLLAYLTTNLAALLMHDEANKAEDLLEESMRARRAAGMSPAPVLTNLGILRSEQGRFSEAERLYREALELVDGDEETRSVLDYREVVLPMQNLAASLAEQRRFPEAAEAYEGALRVAREVGDPFKEGEVRRGLAVCLAEAGDFERSHEQFALLAESAERFGIPAPVVALIVRDLGATATELGRLDEAVEHLRSARRKYSALGDKAGMARTLLDEANTREVDDLEAQVGLVREALETLKGTRHNAMRLDAHERLVWLLFEQRQIEEAISVFGQERRLLRRLGRTRSLARRLAEVSSILASFKLIGRSARLLRRSVELYRSLEDEVGFARARGDLANDLLELGRKREAEQIYLENLESARRAQNRVLEAEALLSLGELRRRDGRTHDAVAWLRESVALSRELNELSGVSTGLNDLGLALEQAGDAEAARRAFEESLKAASDARDESAAARALDSLGNAALEDRDFGRARELFEEAVDRAARGGERGLEASLALNLAAAVRSQRGTSEAESIVERAVGMAQDALHYDTAYVASASMVEWLLQDRDLEDAGEWSAYALLFGSLLSDQLEHWATWMVRVVSGVSDPEDRQRFLDAMQTHCRSIEEENDFPGGTLTRAVETLRDKGA